MMYLEPYHITDSSASETIPEMIIAITLSHTEFRCLCFVKIFNLPWSGTLGVEWILISELRCKGKVINFEHKR